MDKRGGQQLLSGECTPTMFNDVSGNSKTRHTDTTRLEREGEVCRNNYAKMTSIFT